MLVKQLIGKTLRGNYQTRLPEITAFADLIALAHPIPAEVVFAPLSVAGVAELADALDSKSGFLTEVVVRTHSPVPKS